jgi:hypothetical protein
VWLGARLRQVDDRGLDTRHTLGDELQRIEASNDCESMTSACRTCRSGAYASGCDQQHKHATKQAQSSSTNGHENHSH